MQTALTAPEGWQISRPGMFGADIHAYPCTPWTYSGGQASFTCDDSALRTYAFPYIIDPTVSYYPSAGSDDAFSDDTGTSYPPPAPHGSWDGADGNWIIRSYESDTGLYKINLAHLRIDTSALPDNAVVTDATRHIRTVGGYGDNGRGMVGEYYNAWPIDGTDWTETDSDSAWDVVDYSLITLGTWRMFNLKDVDNQINKTGYTGFRIHVSGGIPSGRNQMWVSTSEGTEDPYLTIDYTLPGTSVFGPGSGTVSYFVSANQSGSARQGTITIGDKTFTVTQSNNP